MVVSDPAKLAKIVPPDEGQGATARGRAFIETFGKRAYRRPLTSAEIDTHVTLFAQGPLVLGGDAFTSGVELVLEAFLQSPHFVYRVEGTSTAEPRADGLVPLERHEIATRLAYLLWNTMPDDVLFDASGALSRDTATSDLNPSISSVTTWFCAPRRRVSGASNGRNPGNSTCTTTSPGGMGGATARPLSSDL